MTICENCEKEFTEKYSKWANGRFCCKECARSFSAKKSHKKKISKCVDCNVCVEVDCHILPKLVRCKECSSKYRKTIKNINTHHKKERLLKNSDKYCLNCGVKIPSNIKYCSNKCQHQYIHKLKLQEIREKNGVGCNIPRIKEYLIEIRGHKCEICGNRVWQEKPIPLVLDHINGRAADNRLENLRLVCGNCDMQLPTYKSKNKNSDRKRRNVRMEGWQSGLMHRS